MPLMLPSLDLGPWATTSLAAVADEVVARADTPRTLVLVDGSGGSGKSTFARRLAAALDVVVPDGAHVVSTDDIAWHLHPIEWATELLEGVVEPWLGGAAVDYRPPGWIAKGRPGSVQVAPGTVLVVEGVGAARRSLAELASFVVWVQTDGAVARERILVRDIGVDGDTREEVAEFLDGWMTFEVTHHLQERPWERADLIVDGQYQGADGEVRVATCSSR